MAQVQPTTPDEAALRADSLKRSAYYDPEGRWLREGFELAAYYILVWGFVTCIWYAMYRLAALTNGVRVSDIWTVLPGFQLKAGYLLIPIGLLCALSVPVAVFSSMDGDAGLARKERVERWARRYAFPITLATGIAIGWCFRHQY